MTNLWLRGMLALVGLTLVAAVAFASLPAIDLWVSALFWTPEAGFWRADQPGYDLLRATLKHSGEAAFVVCTAVALANGLIGAAQRTGWRVWAFVAATVALGPGLLVNALLKAHVGRARPQDVAEFGGSHAFTPPFQITDQCAANCSFTSGEAALVAALAVPVLLVLWRNLALGGRLRAVAVAVIYVTAGAGLRVVMGRHFLSDALFSVLFSALIALVLYKMLNIGLARRRFHLDDVPADLSGIWAEARAALARLRGRFRS